VLAVALTAAILLLVIAGSGMLVRAGTLQGGFSAWLVFIRRPDIISTMAITAFVTVMLVYWQRDRER
jgi:hypothetical protein